MGLYAIVGDQQARVKKYLQLLQRGTNFACMLGRSVKNGRENRTGKRTLAEEARWF